VHFASNGFRYEDNTFSPRFLWIAHADLQASFAQYGLEPQAYTCKWILSFVENNIRPPGSGLNIIDCDLNLNTWLNADRSNLLDHVSWGMQINKTLVDPDSGGESYAFQMGKEELGFIAQKL
jgi:hypothetical protein